MRKLLRKSALRLAFLILASLLAASLEVKASELQSTEIQQRISATGETFFTNMSGNGASVSGAGIALGIRYGIWDDLALGFGLGQAFSGSTSIYTEINSRIVYMPSGGLIHSKRTVNANGHTVTRDETLMPTGFRFELLLTHYFFNTARAFGSLQGAGGVVAYEFANPFSQSRDALHLSAGLRMDSISNSLVNLKPVSGLVGMIFRF